MPSDFLIIANPISGAHAAPQLAARVKELLERNGRSVELKLTTARGQAMSIAAEAVAQGVKTVVGCGGDGTLQEIATALDGSSTSLGILPGGRCNDFALALGLNNKKKNSSSPEEFARVFLAGQRRAIDLGAMNARRFLTVATLGFDSEVSRFVETRNLWLKGAPAYLYGVARMLLAFKAPLVKLRGDFGVFEGRILLAATGNSPCYGGALRITPEAKLDDGVFQICVVSEVSKFTVLRIMPHVMNGKHISHPAVKMFQSRSLEIETPERPLWICADGESLGQTPCKLEVRPGALQCLI